MKVRRVTTVLAVVLGLLTFLALAGAASAADTITVQLAPLNNSGESGTATLTDLGDGTTRVVLNLAGGAAGVAQPAHIHEGTCTNLNPTPKYPLQNVTDGKSEMVVKVSLSDLTSGQYAINVHKSAQEVAVYVACGNITAQAAGTTPSAAPRTGGGGMAEQPSLLPWLMAAGLLTLATVGAAYAQRRREA